MHTHTNTHTHGKKSVTKACVHQNQKGSNTLIIVIILTIFEWFLRTFPGNPAFLTAISFTDEAEFSSSVIISYHNQHV